MLYAQRSTLRTRQVLLDAAFLVWVLVWFTVGRWVHDLVGRLATPPERLADAGRALEDAGGRGSDAAGDVPLVGERLADPIARIGDGGTALVNAGETAGSAASDLALVLALLVTLAPIVYVAVRYLPDRIRWVTEAGAASRLLDQPGGHELLALRALANQPLARLARAEPDPATAWREGRTDRLAALEIHRLGLDGRVRPTTGRPGEVTRSGGPGGGGQG